MRGQDYTWLIQDEFELFTDDWVAKAGRILEAVEKPMRLQLLKNQRRLWLESSEEGVDLVGRVLLLLRGWSTWDRLRVVSDLPKH